MPTLEFHVDLDKMLNVALKGVRRASIFMGLGVNAALDPRLDQYQLTNITNISFAPDNLPVNEIEEMKGEFRIWIEANGLRELVETFSVYLDHVHRAALAFKAHGSRTALSILQAEQVKFRSQGFPNKINILNGKFSICPNHPVHLKSINNARNCLAHRLGIVGSDDVKNGPLQILWLGTAVFINTPSGEKHDFRSIPESGLPLPDGGEVTLQLEERRRLLNQGDRVALSTIDLAEICMFFDIEARAIQHSLLEFAKRQGIEVSNPKS
ncbi:MAG TPA: hypothetical protein VN667_22830 [Burkholderiales bacterium]|nr:hypothetical protein [Burkholderiales bacterium]